jgi:tricorn protease interacting factor F2/3
MFSLVRANVVPFESYLTFLNFYEEEDAFLPLSSIDDNLFFAYLVLDKTCRNHISAIGRALALRILKHIGYEPTPEEPQTISMLREQVLWHAAIYGHEDVLGFAEKQFDTLVKGGSIHPDISKSIMQAGAFMGGKSAYDWLCHHLETTASEHARMNVLTALGCFRETALIKSAAQYTLDKVPSRNKFIPLVSMAANPHALPIMWDWYTDHITELETFHPLLYERVIAGIVPIAGMVAPETVRSFFRKYLQDKLLAAEIIRLSLEKLEINLNMRQASIP